MTMRISLPVHPRVTSGDSLSVVSGGLPTMSTRMTIHEQFLEAWFKTAIP